MERSKHAKYYEGILQLRNPSEEILSFLYEKIKQRNDVFISKVDELRTGMDIYLSSKKYLIQIGKMLKERFGGELKVSAEHYSRDRVTSRDLYRVNLLYRVPNFKKGDIIKFRGEELKILYIGKKVSVVNLSNGKRQSLRYSQMGNSKH